MARDTVTETPPCKVSALLITLAFALLLAGCKQDPVRAKLIGTWKIEYGDKLSKQVNQDSDGESGEILDPSERMTLTFYSSGSLNTSTRMGQLNREKNGTWELVKFDSDSSRMTIRCQLMNQQTEHEIQFVDNDVIRLIPPNMAGTTSKLKFRRK